MDHKDLINKQANFEILYNAQKECAGLVGLQLANTLNMIPDSIVNQEDKGIITHGATESISYAAAGAAIGSIIPGIGTVIGALGGVFLASTKQICEEVENKKQKAKMTNKDNNISCNFNDIEEEEDDYSDVDYLKQKYSSN